MFYKKIKLTTYELASEFWNMESTEQAEFFNRIGEFYYTSDSEEFIPMKLEFIINNNVLNEKGIWFIKELYERIIENGK